MNLERIKQAAEQKLKKQVSTDPKLYDVQLLIHSDRLNIHWPMAASKTGEASADQPFHTASIGKSFTSMIIAMMVERRLVQFEDPIANYLPKDILENLHVHKGRDYTQDIQIHHLLSHTSGLPDYFEDKPKQGKPFLQIILDDPARYWNPEETIHWSKAHLHPKFPPGQRVHYSDTGYNLLGLIIEAIASKPYHEVLHEYIFDPLQMRHSYLQHFSEPEIRSQHPIAPIYLGNRKILAEETISFSSFYAGGQTVSTTADLLAFMKAVVNLELIQEETLNKMQQWNRMWPGMDYGYGLMRTGFIPFSKKYVSWGHLGASGTALLYCPNLDTYMISSFNQTAYRSKAMTFVFFNLLRKLHKLATA